MGKYARIRQRRHRVGQISRLAQAERWHHTKRAIARIYFEPWPAADPFNDIMAAQQAVVVVHQPSPSMVINTDGTYYLLYPDPRLNTVEGRLRVLAERCREQGVPFVEALQFVAPRVLEEQADLIAELIDG